MQIILNNQSTTTTPQRPKDLDEICGNFMGYYVTPKGRIISKTRKKFLEPTYRGGIPYIALYENGITSTYRLDEVVFRAFHCTYVIGSKKIIHKDGNQDNCRIRNLSI